MNYPVWYLPDLGGSLLIAIIAIIHVVIAHLAVGGGLFLVLTEKKAYQLKSDGLLLYVKKHTSFFMMLTMVAGGITGVGIWFVIALVQPAATSALIHTFVFGWAIEWVFFMAEIIALLIYYYRFDKMSEKNHVRIGWFYFIFAWLSLFVINGILGFMLTPGKWLETGNFWHGLFNPSFFPALLFRTSIAVIIAGVFGLITASFIKNEELRLTIFKYCAKWMYFPIAILVLTGFYYSSVIGAESFQNVFHFNPESKFFVTAIIFTSFLLFGFGLLTLFRVNNKVQKILAIGLALITFSWMGGFEYLREIARKPYVLYGTMYSNGIEVKDVDQINKDGFLASAKWTNLKVVSDENLVEAGSEIVRLQCFSCHTVNGYNGLKARTSNLTERGLIAQLTGMGKLNTYMPPFVGTEIEKQAVSAFIYRNIQNKGTDIQPVFEADQIPLEIPEFDPVNDKFVLLAWNDLGMHCISDNEKYFSFLPPANTLNAQLFKRGKKPEVLNTGYKIEYEVEKGFEHPENNSLFWEYDKQLFGVDLEPGTGLAGKKVKGEMDKMGDRYAAHLIPVVPYTDEGEYNPYPIFTLKALDEKTGEIVAVTKTVAPTSTEMGCRNCHEGGWRWNDKSGVADKTAINILAAHDKYNGTTLLTDAEEGNPALCQSCHADPALGASGKKGILNFSSAMHGFHANYLSNMDQESCNMCHPSRAEGNTNCFRGRHAKVGLNCTTCHGRIEDHALSLLVFQTDVKASSRLSKNLKPYFVSSQEEIKGRKPWLIEPDCKSCHTNFNMKEDGFKGTAFNSWVEGFADLYRNRTDNQGVMCISCHGSTHAVYGAMNKYGLQRDNMQPLQYQHLAGTIATGNNCMVCHTVKMDYNGHHRNMVNRKFKAATVE